MRKSVAQISALSDPTQLVRAAVENMTDGFVIADVDGAILLFNSAAERMFGWTEAELLGENVGALMREPDRADHAGYIARYRQGGTPHILGEAGRLLTAQRKDGSTFPLELGVDRIDLAGGRGFVGVMRNLSERVAWEQRLQAENERVVAATRAKTEFIRSMAHEMRTPLSVITGFAKRLASAKDGPVSDLQLRHLAHIQSSGDFLIRLVDDMLDLAKIEASATTLKPEPVHVRQALEWFIAEHVASARKKSLQVEIEVDPELTVVTADPLRLKQVVSNYLSNAIKFTPDGGKITVGAAPSGEEDFEVWVADSGPGIAAEDLERVFEEFVQVGRHGRGGREGSGLGLAIVRRIVEAQHGTVGVSSEPGHGCRFHAVLPLEFGAAPPVVVEET